MLKCPKCRCEVEAVYARKANICPNCLEHRGETIIMVESNAAPSPRNLGGGFFEKPKGD
jgi:hypothetical protein